MATTGPGADYVEEPVVERNVYKGDGEVRHARACGLKGVLRAHVIDHWDCKVTVTLTA